MKSTSQTRQKNNNFNSATEVKVSRLKTPVKSSKLQNVQSPINQKRSDSKSAKRPSDLFAR